MMRALLHTAVQSPKTVAMTKGDNPTMADTAIPATRPLQRPEAAIRRLVEAFLPASRHVHLRPNRPHVLGPGHQALWLLTHGRIDLLRPHDGLILTTVHAPYVIGLSNMLHPHQSCLLQLSGECPSPVLSAHLRTVSPEAVEALLATQPALWQDVAGVLAYAVQFSAERDARLTTARAYDTVRALLQELMWGPEELRRQVSAMGYIERRTTLSRSAVALILKSLRDGQYIVMNQGRLLAINHLPEAY